MLEPTEMKRPLLTFFALTFTLTWVSWAAAAALIGTGNAVLRALASGVVLLGTFAPGIISLLMTRRAGGAVALDRLLGRVVQVQVGAGWYLFAVLFIPLLKVTAALVQRLASGTWPRFGATPWYLMLIALAISTWAQAGEELGWRGYALPRLASLLGLAPASVLLGVIWACWHLPLFFFPGSETAGQSFPLYLLQVTGLSVVMAWIYWRTNGSLLLVMLFHAAVNNTKDIVPSATPGARSTFTLHASEVGWITVALLWTFAAVLLFAMRRVRQVPGGEADFEAREDAAGRAGLQREVAAASPPRADHLPVRSPGV
jgi:membrane protease YdiL (CAAX protease family)